MTGNERWTPEPGQREVVSSPAETSGAVRLPGTAEDLCRFLGVSRRRLHERTRHSEIPCYRFGSMLWAPIPASPRPYTPSLPETNSDRPEEPAGS